MNRAKRPLVLISKDKGGSSSGQNLSADEEELLTTGVEGQLHVSAKESLPGSQVEIDSVKASLLGVRKAIATLTEGRAARELDRQEWSKRALTSLGGSPEQTAALGCEASYRNEIKEMHGQLERLLEKEMNLLEKELNLLKEEKDRRDRLQWQWNADQESKLFFISYTLPAWWEKVMKEELKLKYYENGENDMECEDYETNKDYDDFKDYEDRFRENAQGDARGQEPQAGTLEMQLYTKLGPVAFGRYTRLHNLLVDFHDMEAEGEAELQKKLISTLAPFIRKTDDRTMHDTHATPTLCGLKPDACLTSINYSPSPVTVQVVVELKNEEPVSQNHKAQGGNYLRVILRHQPQRKKAVCLLITKTTLCVMVCFNLGWVALYSQEISLKTPLAVYMLDYYLNSELVPCDIPDSYLKEGGENGIKLELSFEGASLLSKSLLSTVYVVNSLEQVCKRVHDERLFTTELAILRKLAKVKGVVILEGVNESMKTFVFPYLGMPLGSIKYFRTKHASIFSRLVDIIKEVHEANIIHRDVRCANILIDKSNKVTLIDFGLAIEGSREDSATGTIIYMPQAHYSSLAEHGPVTFDASTDLESLVKTWIVTQDSGLRHDMHRPGLQPMEYSEKWEELLRIPKYASAMEAARCCQYDVLKECFTLSQSEE